MKYAAAVLILLAALFALSLAAGKGESETTAPLPGILEIADTPEERERGLSGRALLPDDYGMLFAFEREGAYSFWMKDMQVSIDIVWIAESGRIAGIEAGVAPETYPEAFSPPEPVRYVLEVAEGEAARRGYAPGVVLSIPK